MQPDISVVIPVYGSATILPTLVEKLEESLTALTDKFEVVLVYDCSPDNSWQVITGLCTSRPWLKGVRLRKNAGQHNALMAGFGVARGRYIVTMDDDLQHSPSDIGRVVAGAAKWSRCLLRAVQKPAARSLEAPRQPVQ